MKSRGLLLFAAILLLARFIHLDRASFVLDEPHFQTLIDQALRAHQLPRVSLHGIKGIAYGPTVLWFYFPLRLLSANVTAILAWNALFSVLGLLALYLAARKTAGKKVAAWTLALTASSPYLFMYSRTAWDQPLLIPLLGAMAWAFASLPEKPLSPWLWGSIGLLAGLCFDLHLETLPVLFAVVLVLGWVGWQAWRPSRSRRIGAPTGTKTGACFAASPLVSSGVFLAAFFLVTAPYLLSLSPGRGNFSPSFWPEDALRSLYYSSRFFSWKGMDYFFQSPATRGPVSRLAFAVDWSYALRITACVAIGLWIRKAWRQRGLAKIPPLLVFGIVSWLTLLVFYAIARPDIKNPQYLLPVWWVLFFFASWAVVHSRGRVRAALEACAWLTLVLNAAFIGVSWNWLNANSGARSLEFGPAQAEIARATRVLCQDVQRDAHGDTRGPRPPGVVRVGLEGVNLFPESLEFISAHEPDCTGEQLEFSRDAVGARFQPDYRIEYASPTGPSALLAVRPARKAAASHLGLFEHPAIWFFNTP